MSDADSTREERSSTSHPISDEAWGEYKDGLKMRLDSCKAVAVWCGLLVVIARLTAATGCAQLWLIIGVGFLILAFGIAVWLQLIAGWTLSILGGAEPSKDVISWLPFVDMPKDWPAGDDRRGHASKSLDEAAATMGKAEYGLAFMGTAAVVVGVVLAAVS